MMKEKEAKKLRIKSSSSEVELELDDEAPDYSSKLRSHTELLELIFTRSSVIDIIRFRAVCSLWNQVVVDAAFLQIPELVNRPVLEIPWLTIIPRVYYASVFTLDKVKDDDKDIPLEDEDNDNVDYKDISAGDEDNDDVDYDVWCFMNIQLNKFHKVKAALPEKLARRLCVGSSHGWLVLLDEPSEPNDMSLWLFNPLTRARLQLPPLRTLPSIVQFKYGQIVEEDDDQVTICQTINITYDLGGSCHHNETGIERSKGVHLCLIAKAVLFGEPPNYGVIVIYGRVFYRPHADPRPYSNMLAFWRRDNPTWTELCGKHKSYCDITCYNHTLYALCDEGCLEVWDFHKSSSPPQPIMYIDATSFPKQFISGWTHILDSCTCNSSDRCSFNCFYLVESSPHLFLVVRTIEQYHHLGDPFFGSISTTLLFHVYRMDFIFKKWIKVDSLGDLAFFLGDNHALSLSVRDVPNFKHNSIYFTKEHTLDQYCQDKGASSAYKLKQSNL